MVSKKTVIYCILIFIVGVFVFSQGLAQHGLEYRDDEVFYYQSTQEMVATGNYMSPTYFGKNRFQKPILFYWLVLLSYKIFGLNWFGARFASVVIASLALVVNWLMAKKLFDSKTALLSTGILMTLPMFMRHAKNVVPDMALNFFIVLAIYFMILVVEEKSQSKYSILFFLSCGLGFMIKGFAALIVPFMVVFIYAFLNKKLDLVKRMSFGKGLVVLAIVILPWFIYMIAKHGSVYINYMLVDETKDRLLDNRTASFVLYAKGLVDRMGFYFQVIMSYFAPWGIFVVAAIPLALKNVLLKKVDSESVGESQRDGLVIMLIWFFSVFGFFSIMSFSINHYMLVLSTPFAILISRFLLWEGSKDSKMYSVLSFLRKLFLILFICAGTFVFSFLVVFLLAKSKFWLIVFIVLLAVMLKIAFSRKVIYAPMVLVVFIALLFSQSRILSEANVTAHSSLQKFAKTINKDSESFVIGVGSNDIHEKEFQIYFNKKVVKAANSSDNETEDMLKALFGGSGKVYCLFIEEDLEEYLSKYSLGPMEKLQSEYIFRRRMSIDKGFFVGILNLDGKIVRNYLMEKVVLVRKLSAL